MPGRQQHSPEGPALFCSKPEMFEKSQKSASFFGVSFGVLLLLFKEKEKTEAFA